MSPLEGGKTTRRKARLTTVRSGGKPGAWLDWSTVSILCKLDLRPPSLWQVFLAVSFTSARYGGRDAKLRIDDLCRMTDLASRTVKGAVAELIARNLLSRVGRYGCLRVNFPVASPGGADELANPVAGREIGRGADKPAPPRCKLACTSPTSINVSCLNEEIRGPATFTALQLSLIADVFAEATESLGSDAAMLTVPDGAAVALGLTPPISYGEAGGAVARSGDRARARHFTRAVLALRRDERVQGQELGREPPDTPTADQSGSRSSA